MKKTLGQALLATLLGIGFLAASTPALARPGDTKVAGATAASRTKARAFPQRVKTYDFTPDEVNGTIVGPDGEGYTARKEVQHTSLIKPRVSFVGEITKSTLDL